MGGDFLMLRMRAFQIAAMLRALSSASSSSVNKRFSRISRAASICSDRRFGWPVRDRSKAGLPVSLIEGSEMRKAGGTGLRLARISCSANLIG